MSKNLQPIGKGKISDNLESLPKELSHLNNLIFDIYEQSKRSYRLKIEDKLVWVEKKYVKYV